MVEIDHKIDQRSTTILLGEVAGCEKKFNVRKIFMECAS